MFAPTKLLLPNSALLMAPHESIDGSIGVTPTRFCAPGFVRSQSGTKLRLASTHVRVTDGLANAAAVPPGMRSDGLALGSRLPTLAPCRYLPTFAFSAVLPLPNR